MNQVTFPAVLTVAGGQVKVDFPDLPNAFAHGDDESAALNNARLSLALVVIDLQTHFETVPAPTPLADLQRARPGADIREVTVDLDQY